MTVAYDTPTVILDIRTLLVAQAILSFALAGAVLSTDPTDARDRLAARLWSLGALAIGIGHAALAMQGLATPLLGEVASNTLLIGGCLLYAQAIAAAAGRAPPARWPWYSAGLVVLVATYHVLLPTGQAGHPWRAVGFTVLLALIVAKAEVDLRRALRRLPGATLIRVTNLVLLALMALRATGAVLQPQITLLTPSPMHVVLFLSNMAANALLTIGLMTMLTGSARHRADRLARIDVLTEVLNRRGLFEELERAMAAARRDYAVVSVVSFDLDRFKQVNDRFGHAAGDDTLSAFAQVLRRSVRASDRVGRLGGEEFIVLLPRQDARAARQVAERVRASLAQDGIGPGGMIVTVSAGIAASTEAPVQGDVGRLLKAADARLYAAKRTRDTIVDADSPQPPQPSEPSEPLQPPRPSEPPSRP